MFTDITNNINSDNQNVESMEQEMRNLVTLLVKQWANGPHDGTEAVMELLQEKLDHWPCELRPETEKEVCLYNLGVLQGVTYFLQKLAMTDAEDSCLYKGMVIQPDMAKRALYFLEKRNGEAHDVLAKYLDTSDMGLTSIMSDLVCFGAVKSSQYEGKTTYSITDAGKRYIANRRKFCG